MSSDTDISQGESNGLINRRRTMKRETFVAAASAYQGLFENKDGYIPATFQIIFMIGWKPETKPAGDTIITTTQA